MQQNTAYLRTRSWFGSSIKWERAAISWHKAVVSDASLSNGITTQKNHIFPVLQSWDQGLKTRVHSRRSRSSYQDLGAKVSVSTLRPRSHTVNKNETGILGYYITLKGVLITENLEHSVVILRPRSHETRVHSSSLSQGLGLGFEALTPRSSWVCVEIFKRVLSQQNCIFHLNNKMSQCKNKHCMERYYRHVQINW